MSFCRNCGRELERADGICLRCGGVRLFFNAKYSYFSDTSGPLELKLKNISNGALNDIELNLCCPELALERSLFIAQVEAGGEEVVDCDFRIPSNTRGLHSVQIRVTCYADDHVLLYQKKQRIQVFKGIEGALKLNIDFSKAGKVMGNYIDIDLKDAVRSGAIDSVDDLLQKQLAAQDKWVEVALKHVTSRFKLAGRLPAEVSDSMMLVDEADPGRRYYLFTKPRLVFGRSEEATEVCIVHYPFDESQADSPSQRISRRQFLIEIRENKVILKNLCSANSLGTVVGGRKLSPKEELPLEDGMEINVAYVLKLRVAIHSPDLSRKDRVEADEWGRVPGLSRPAECNQPLRDFSKNRRISGISFIREAMLGGANRPSERYLLVADCATVGSDPSRAIAIESSGVGDPQARIYHHAGYFFLQVAKQGLGNTLVNGRRAEESDLLPIAPGDVLSFGTSSWHAKEVAWDLRGER